ncbi:sulfite oxidase [Methylobacterium sp. Leaf118]|uniref:sulfite oxidase n=1 Tax=Methylobacterium sp. Leaf118 TaxID=2876562 RepID=UPI001E411E6C|nr:sulfite oxidase [Methylobacterium sp. Leaf118]
MTLKSDDATAIPRRPTGLDRRGFLARAGLAGAALGAGGAMTPGTVQAQETKPAEASKPGGTAEPAAFAYEGKDAGLTGLGDRPLVAETPAHLLDDDTTPITKFFIRCNGQVPEPAADRETWSLTIDGEVEAPLVLSLKELKDRFKPVTYRMVLECGGNGRSSFQPPARGNQWTNGGAGCAEWTGIPLNAVLQAAKVKPSARYTAHHGADPHLSGDAKKDSLSRGMPVAKAMDAHNLLVFAMNGEPLPTIHGGPLRLVVPGWPGSLSHKWLTRITLRDREHDGQGMTGHSYRLPERPLVPGSKGDGVPFRILESMPVRAVTTSPANGTRLPAGARDLDLRGAAWGGEVPIARVEVSIDGGQTWTEAALAPLKNRYDWHRWTARLTLPSDGYYEIFARATDVSGRTQPTLATNWNPQGYGGNAQHRIAILVG